MQRFSLIACIAVMFPIAAHAQVVLPTNALGLPKGKISCEIGARSRVDSTYASFHFEEDSGDDDRAIDVEFDSTGASRLIALIASHKMSDTSVVEHGVLARLTPPTEVDGFHIVELPPSKAEPTGGRLQMPFTDKDKADILTLSKWLWANACHKRTLEK
jgi:hypothetical protein